FYCFGCGKGGDVVSFVRETENLDFVGAIEWLAERFRVPLRYEETSPAAEEARRSRERLLALLEQAASYFERLLWESPAGEPVRAYLASRGLGEAVAREFRLGLAPGQGLAAKARERGFSERELRAAGLVNARGNDYFPRRLMFPLADARGRVIGFQARKLHDDDPLRGKYVNSPESELFRKGDVVYGLDRARDAILKEERACVVEGNTDVLALRQAGFRPVVACMGTALTEAQLRELGRLAKRLFLAFDGDEAGEAATLRGMELAVARGFEVNVVALPPGVDPADDPAGFEARLASAAPYAVHRTQVEADRGGFQAVTAFLRPLPDTPEKREAIRWASDRFGMAPQLPSVRATQAALSPRRVAAAIRRERAALAGVVAHPSLVPILAELPPHHFHDEASRAVRAHLVDGAPVEGEALGLLAELDARAEAEGIDKQTAEELLLRLRMDELRAELRHADLERTRELQEALLRIREAVESLGAEAPVGD